MRKCDLCLSSVWEEWSLMGIYLVCWSLWMSQENGCLLLVGLLLNEYIGVIVVGMGDLQVEVTEV